MKKKTLALGAIVSLSLATAPVFSEDVNPFEATSLAGGFILAKADIKPNKTTRPSFSNMANANKKIVKAGNQFDKGMGKLIIIDIIKQIEAINLSNGGSIRKLKRGFNRISKRII